MGRPRAEISESVEDLAQFEELCESEDQRVRITALRLLREDPARTMAQVASMVGRSERSVQRWWDLYQSDGLLALLSQRTARRERRLSSEAVDLLRKQLASEGFRAVSDAQAWIEDRLGVTYSRSGVWNLLRSEAGASRGLWAVHQSRRASRIEAEPTPRAVTERVVGFLNSFPTSMDGVQWINSFRDSLLEMFDDLDRISIIVNTHCDLLAPEEYGVPTVHIAHHRRGSRGTQSVISVRPEENEQPRWMSILEDFKHQGYPLHEYHEPRGYDYYYQGQAYLGTIFLWRSAGKPAISEDTIALFESLEPFLTFMLSDMVTRHQYQKPVDKVFYQAFERLVDEASLSPQERRIIALQLLGQSYKEMADTLSVSVDTVKKHFKQIHKKTGTRGQAELFAKYFTAKLPELQR